MNEDGFYNSYDAEFSDDSIGQVTASEHVLDDKKYKFLKDKMMEEFYNFIRGEMKYPNEFEITTSWFTKTTRGQASPMHNHDNCMFSCVLYLQPEWSRRDSVMPLMVEYVLQNPKWKVSLQTHKYLNIP